MAPTLLFIPVKRGARGVGREEMYNVMVDRAAMREELLGPLFQRYVVSLTGTVDQLWLASFHEVAKDSETFKRYRLEPDKGLISFTCRASDGPRVIDSFLERMTLFVEMVNLHATCAVASPETDDHAVKLSA